MLLTLIFNWIFSSQTRRRHSLALPLLDRGNVGDGGHADPHPLPQERDHRPLRQARQLLEEQRIQELPKIEHGNSWVNCDNF